MNIELAKRAVACKHWEWVPGMKLQDGRRVIVIQDTSALLSATNNQVGWFPILENDSEVLPDLDDPATFGCILHLVRKAWRDKDFSMYKDGAWTGLLHVHDQNYLFKLKPYGFSEIETLIHILENGP
jgi:hypothetical protein